jgi:hypothetical protein
MSCSGSRLVTCIRKKSLVNLLQIVIDLFCYIVEKNTWRAEVEKGISTALSGDALVVRVAHVPQGGSPTFTFSELSAVHSPVIGSQ